MKTANSKRQMGLSLVEMMVALSLGLMLTVTVTTILSGSLAIFRVQGENARLQESSRFLMDTLGRQITQAGYAAISSDYNDTRVSFVGTPISGEHGVVATRSGERKNGSDYLAVSFDANVDCQGNVVAGGTVRNEFFLNASDELVCASAGGAGEVLVDGVEAFQVLYGVDADGDFSVERHVAQPGDWSQVRTVRVCAVVRAFSRGTSPTAQQYQDCSGAAQTAPDTRLRRVLSATFQLRNRGV